MTEAAALCKVTMREMLPASMAEVGDLLGDRPLLKLIEAHGGTRLYIPASIGEFDPLALLLGTKPARRLVAVYGRDTMVVSLCKRWRASMLRAEGLSCAAIARRIGMTEQSVWRMLSGNRAEGEEATAQLRFRFE